MTKENLLDIIIENGLSIRQIPHKITETYDLKHFREGDETIERVVREDVSKEKYEEGLAKGLLNASFRWEDRKMYRKFCRRYKVPKNAGFWMCKKINNSDSMVQWSIKDNLAPTLEESISLFLLNNK